MGTEKAVKPADLDKCPACARPRGDSLERPQGTPGQDARTGKLIDHPPAVELCPCGYVYGPARA